LAEGVDLWPPAPLAPELIRAAAAKAAADLAARRTDSPQDPPSPPGPAWQGMGLL